MQRKSITVPCWNRYKSLTKSTTVLQWPLSSILPTHLITVFSKTNQNKRKSKPSFICKDLIERLVKKGWWVNCVHYLKSLKFDRPILKVILLDLHKFKNSERNVKLHFHLVRIEVLYHNFHRLMYFTCIFEQRNFYSVVNMQMKWSTVN